MDESIHSAESPAVDELIIRVLNGTASGSEEEEVRRWRAEAPGNEAYFLRTERVWLATEPGKGKQDPAPPPVSGILRDSESRRGGSGRQGSGRGADGPAGGPRGRSLLVRRTLAMAAAIAAVVLGVQVVRTPPSAPRPIATHVAGEAAAATVVLEDGSLVRLAPDGRLDQWAAEGERRFHLTGRAFFAVAHDAARPFVVGAEAAEVRVLGTRFELAQVDGTLRAVVVDGRVAVSNAQGQVEVGRGARGTEARRQ